MFPEMFPGGGVLSPQPSVDLPTFTATVTDTSDYAIPTDTLTATQYATSPLVTDLPPVCSQCEEGMPGVLPGPSTFTASQLTATATPTQAVIGGIFKIGPTSSSAIWYRQPWTIPAAWLLCCYALFSIITLAILLFSGRMDLKGNLYFGRAGRESRRLYNERLDLWHMDSYHADADRHRTTLEREVQVEEEARRRVRVQAARSAALAMLEGHRIQGNNTSVAEMELAYGTENERGYQRWSMEPLNPEDHIELETFPAGAGSPHRYIFYRGTHGQVVRVTRDGPMPFASIGEQERFRNAVRREQQARLWRLQHLNELQASMARAGWM